MFSSSTEDLTYRISAILVLNVSEDGYSNLDGFKPLTISDISSSVRFIAY